MKDIVVISCIVRQKCGSCFWCSSEGTLSSRTRTLAPRMPPSSGPAACSPDRMSERKRGENSASPNSHYPHEFVCFHSACARFRVLAGEADFAWAAVAEWGRATAAGGLLHWFRICDMLSSVEQLCQGEHSHPLAGWRESSWQLCLYF